MDKKEKDLFQEHDTKERAEVLLEDETVHNEVLMNAEESFTGEGLDVNKKGEKESRIKKERMIREVLSYAFIIVLAYVIATLISNYIFSLVTVEMSSMEPTLHEGDKLILWRLGDLDRFDVVVFEDPRQPGKYLIKRLIGVPGDYLEYKNDKLHINGEPLQEDYIKDGIYRPEKEYTLEDICKISEIDFSACFTSDGEIRIPEGYYFVLGDNRQNSVDSDDEQIGLVPEELFQGKIIFRIKGGFGRLN